MVQIMEMMTRAKQNGGDDRAPVMLLLLMVAMMTDDFFSDDGVFMITCPEKTMVFGDDDACDDEADAIDCEENDGACKPPEVGLKGCESHGRAHTSDC